MRCVDNDIYIYNDNTCVVDKMFHYFIVRWIHNGSILDFSILCGLSDTITYGPNKIETYDYKSVQSKISRQHDRHLEFFYGLLKLDTWSQVINSTKNLCQEQSSRLYFINLSPRFQGKAVFLLSTSIKRIFLIH